MAGVKGMPLSDIPDAPLTMMWSLLLTMLEHPALIQVMTGTSVDHFVEKDLSFVLMEIAAELDTRPDARERILSGTSAPAAWRTAWALLEKVGAI